MQSVLGISHNMLIDPHDASHVCMPLCVCWPRLCRTERRPMSYGPLSVWLPWWRVTQGFSWVTLYADKSSPFQMAQSLASQLQEVPAEDVLLSLHHVPQVNPSRTHPSCLSGEHSPGTQIFSPCTKAHADFGNF